MSVSVGSNPLDLLLSKGHDASLERVDGVGPGRTARRHRSIGEKRRIVELALEPGASVARVAQTAGVNANQVFKWRREYRNGRLVEAAGSTTSLLPVSTCRRFLKACGDGQLHSWRTEDQVRISWGTSMNGRASRSGVVEVERKNGCKENLPARWAL